MLSRIDSGRVVGSESMFVYRFIDKTLVVFPASLVQKQNNSRCNNITRADSASAIYRSTVG